MSWRIEGDSLKTTTIATVAVLMTLMLSMSGCILTDWSRRDYNIEESIEIKLEPEFTGEYYIVLPALLQDEDKLAPLFNQLKVEGYGSAGIGQMVDGTMGVNATGSGDVTLTNQLKRTYKDNEASERFLGYEWSYAGQGGGDVSIFVHGDMYDDTQEPNIKVSFTYKATSNYCVKNEFYGATLALNGTWLEIYGARDMSCAD